MTKICIAVLSASAFEFALVPKVLGFCSMWRFASQFRCLLTFCTRQGFTLKRTLRWRQAAWTKDSEVEPRLCREQEIVTLEGFGEQVHFLRLNGRTGGLTEPPGQCPGKGKTAQRNFAVTQFNTRLYVQQHNDSDVFLRWKLVVKPLSVSQRSSMGQQDFGDSPADL